MLKSKRLVSFIAMLAICFSFLVPAFVAPDQAAASSTYTVLSAPTKTKDQSPGALGSVEIYVPNTSAFTESYDYLTISLPDKVYTNYSNTIPTTWQSYSAINAGNFGIKLYLPTNVDGDTNGIASSAVYAKISSKTTFELMIDKAGVTPGLAGKINVTFDNLTWSDFGGGDVTATFMPPLSGTTAFTAGSAVIGKISSETGTTAMAKSVKTLAKGEIGEIDTIIVAETAVGTLSSGDQIKLKLPANYKWVTTGAVVAGSWAFDNTASPYDHYIISTESDGRTLVVTINHNTRTPASAAGRVNIGINDHFFKIDVPDTASNGDVYCNVSGDNVTDQDIVIAKVGDYGISVSEGDKTEVISGHKDQKLGSFYIEESLPGSLVKNRSIKISLPSGVKWDVANGYPKVDITGSVSLSSPSLNSDKDALTYTVSSDSSGGTASKIKIYEGKVQISPAFSGPIKITISGTAGVTGEVTVAECKPIVTMTADASKTLIIGLPNQVASDITITEGTKGAILDAVPTDGTKSIQVALPAGVTFSATPKVTVAEGDLEIDTYKLVSYNNVSDAALQIDIKSSSTKASKIVISDVKLTLDRTVPEGQLKAKLAVVDDDGYSLDETDLWDTRDSAGSVAIGTCVTPAPANQGRSALFTIGSNIATMNGSYVIMDAAPYIKASRTYIPVRYLADALGATTQWDPATQTATLTLGDKSVVLVIGSKVEKVNGADVTMDVAPEIVNGRTMLPARYVAEGLGYQVGWNGVTKQVIIQ